MTTSTIAGARPDVLGRRLEELRAERAVALAELASDGAGDAADRATNVDANVRFALLEQRIAAVESELNRQRAGRTDDGKVTVGDVVTLGLGDGPETFLFGPVEQAGDGLDVVTPGSPLGAAIDGVTAGTDVSYRIGSRTLTARVIAIS
jgi:transcription elongation factor GreA